MDKFDVDLMYEQTDTFMKIVGKLLTMTKEEIGHSDGYSLVFPNGEPVLYKTVKGLIHKISNKEATEPNDNKDEEIDEEDIE